jgi:hypothetical protein
MNSLRNNEPPPRHHGDVEYPEIDRLRDELAEAHDAIANLAHENQDLRDKLAACDMEADGAALILELRFQLNHTEHLLRAVESVRDSYLLDNGELKRRCKGLESSQKILKKRIAKLEPFEVHTI